MTNSPPRPGSFAQRAVFAVAGFFFLASSWVSFARWASFQYRTFDLAYYVQALWQLVHGRLHNTVLGVPLLGNHAEPIVLLIAPIFALIPHPMVLVLAQNAALAAIGPIAFRIGLQLGLRKRPAALLAMALLLMPASGYIALHEFHPEALAAPFLLSMFYARLRSKLGRYWIWFLAVLACKENLALLLATYCVVHLIIERKRPVAELRNWFFWPLAVALSWLLLYSKIIGPALNPGTIDYLTLYNRLGASGSDILRNFISQPQIFASALMNSLSHGNLFWVLLLCSLGLPLLRPRWLIISAPILLQHLLSWRSSEWTIYFHYAAPILPLFWMATAETVAGLPARPKASRNLPGLLPALLLLTAAVAQLVFGPAAALVQGTDDWFRQSETRARKNTLLDHIPAPASVIAPLPYLSHLATREKIYSLHHLLKGLNTLSHDIYTPPPPTDFVLVDYGDSATFDASAGYYHPTMKTSAGRIVPSSDRLLHLFLRNAAWEENQTNEVMLLQRTAQPMASPAPLQSNSSIEIAPHTRLRSIRLLDHRLSTRHPLMIELDWRFDGEREIFPWLLLRMRREGNGQSPVVIKGLCAPQIATGDYTEHWRVTPSPDFSSGEYTLEALFFDNTKRAWSNESSAVLAAPINLGRVTVESKDRP